MIAPEARRPRSGTFLVLGVVAVGTVFAAYSNHFRNSFHFDDGTVIQNNAYLRSLHNIPLFFRDATTFSSYPPNAAYRPLTSTSFALDYWLGGGIDPFLFHVTQWEIRSPATKAAELKTADREQRWEPPRVAEALTRASPGCILRPPSPSSIRHLLCL